MEKQNIGLVAQTLTTNYFVLQSFLEIGDCLSEVYAFFPEKPMYTLFGKEYRDGHPPSQNVAEKSTHI